MRALARQDNIWPNVTRFQLFTLFLSAADTLGKSFLFKAFVEYALEKARQDYSYLAGIIMLLIEVLRYHKELHYNHGGRLLEAHLRTALSGKWLEITLTGLARLPDGE